MAIREHDHSILIDREKCIGCVACNKACPTRAIRVRDRLASVNAELCIDCGECIRACRYDAALAQTSSTSDLKKFRYRVAMPSITLYGQFGPDVHPGQVLRALQKLGFDETYDISYMCEMVAAATDAYLTECKGPWPKISVTCPAIVRLIQIRYPDVLPHLVPIESARELGGKLLRRKLARELVIPPEDIGIFFITPCSAIMRSILAPVGLEQSYLDGAFSIAELYGPLLRAIKETPPSDLDPLISASGLLWAMAGGEIAGMRNANSMTVRGVRDVEYVFDRIESGKFQSVDFIEAYICPDGCVSGQLTVEGRYAAQRSIQRIAKKLGTQEVVKEEKVRSLMREHFFDLEEELVARRVDPLPRDLKKAIERKRTRTQILEQLPAMDCAACGRPDCPTLADEIVDGSGRLEDCVIVRVKQLEERLEESGAKKEGHA